MLSGQILRDEISMIVSLSAQAVKKFQLASDGGWLAAHLTHVLALCGKMGGEDKLVHKSCDEETVQAKFLKPITSLHRSDEDDENACSRLDLKLILEYGTLLMCHPSLWQVGLCYLDQCPGEGIARQQILLANIVPNTDMKAMKLIQAAVCRGLVDVGK